MSSISRHVWDVHRMFSPQCFIYKGFPLFDTTVSIYMQVKYDIPKHKVYGFYGRLEADGNDNKSRREWYLRNGRQQEESERERERAI